MKTYRGYRYPAGQLVGISVNPGCVVTVEQGEYTYALPPRHDLRNHSPDGFEWGYGGSGPAQLALALLADLFGDELAQRHYQTFKFRVVARLAGDGWLLTETEIRERIADLIQLRQDDGA